MRRSSYNTRNPYLPMTEEDVVRRLLHQKTRRLMRKRKKAIGKWLARVNSPSFVLVAICAMFAAAALVHFLWRRHPTRPLHHSITNLSPDNPVVQKGDSAAAATGGRRALTEQFPSLEYALSHSKLVALYFAASWCPMSTPVSEMLDHEDFAALLVPPPPSPDAPLDKEPDKRSGSASPFVSLVYVGSDRSHEQMTQYLQHRPRWMHVPYDSVDRTKLKQHFQTAAKVEMKDLGMDSRKHEIPTVIVIDAGSQQVLTFSGVKDVEEHGARNAVDTWLELAKLSQALDAKFASREADDDPTAD
jgi:Thioredoxin-like